MLGIRLHRQEAHMAGSQDAVWVLVYSILFVALMVSWVAIPA